MTTLEGELNRFLHRHPVIGVILFVGGASGALILGGMAYEAAPKLVGALGICTLVMMVLAGNRHLS